LHDGIPLSTWVNRLSVQVKFSSTSDEVSNHAGESIIVGHLVAQAGFDFINQCIVVCGFACLMRPVVSNAS
jgi:hypothetical protein